MDYHFDRFEAGPFVRVDVLINGDRVDALSLIVHRAQAERRGRELVERMKRTDSAAAVRRGHPGRDRRPDDRPFDREGVAQERAGKMLRRRRFSRKKKLLEKQKEGKKRMKQVGRVEIPQEAFLAVLRTDKS